ncbi:hypothetical protein HK103_006308 [Boothiomyces macroporosus]|uniref:Uncharacterized protein n=1 Tax=Boothiomyces macroporosus TaxID=261099 RepID=A0AAD5UE97_9FUNG|nr:hypothetical protein HK103_006308 [Boothiomyces macroporosus]
MLFPKYELGIFYSVNNNSSELQHGMIVNHLFESVPFDEQEKVTFNYHQTPPKKIPLDIAPESKFDLKRFAGYYRTTRFHHSTYLAMFGMSYYPEICISVSKGGNSLRYAGTELIPLYEGEKQVVFWVKNETEGKLPSNRYTTMAFEDVKSSKPNVYMFFTNGAAHKLRWFERKAVQNSIYFSSIGLASSQLAYGALYFALSSRIANLPKVSLAATAIGLGINLFPLTNYIQDKTKKNEVELMSKRPPLWGKVCVALSQTTVALGAGYILLKYGGKKVHPQEVLALLAAGSYLGFIHYWNFECWKL